MILALHAFPRTTMEIYTSILNQLITALDVKFIAVVFVQAEWKSRIEEAGGQVHAKIRKGIIL